MTSEILTELSPGEGAMVSPPPVPCSSCPLSCLPIGPGPGYCALIGPALSLWFIWQKMLPARFLFDLEWLLEMSNATGVSSIIWESSEKSLINRLFNAAQYISSYPYRILFLKILPGTVSSASLLSRSSCLAYLEQYIFWNMKGFYREILPSPLNPGSPDGPVNAAVEADNYCHWDHAKQN